MCAAGAVAAVASCWPVVFAGRSFVSPLNGTLPELYERAPYVPGAAAAPVGDMHGSDTAAMIWAFVPYAVVQHRALMEDHELPLWNRYNACGLPLLGQGLSMLGDPLQWLPILSGGAAWAWDLKFVLAKGLWCAGIGVAVLLATEHVPAAALLAVSSAWIGFFTFRINHTAFFTLSYAPWILVCWFGLARAARPRTAGGWIAGGAVATWMVMASGTVKEATLLIASLHLTGAMAWWMTPALPAVRRRTAWRLLAGAAGTVALTAPLWATFGATLAQAHTISDDPYAIWTPLSLLPGFFDDLFSRAFNPDGVVNAPSANGLYLAGVLWWVAAWTVTRRARPEPAVQAVVVGAIPSFALTFGLLPAADILSVPLLRNALALDNVGGCVLLVHAAVLGGAGFAAGWRAAGDPRWRRVGMMATALLGGMVGLHLLLAEAVRGALRSMTTVLTGFPITHDAAFWRQAALFTASVALLPLVWRMTATPRRRKAGVVGLLALGAVIHGRHGMALHAPPQWPGVIPGPRLDARLGSVALERLAAAAASPQRVVGFDWVLFPGYSGIHAIEGIGGPDALQDTRYRELLLAAGLSPIWSWWYRVQRADAVRMRPLLDLLNVGWYAGQPDGAVQPAVPGLVRVARLDLDLWRSPTVWPRAFFTDAVRPCDSAKAFIAMLRTGDGRPFAVVDPADLPRVPGSRGPERRIVAARGYRLTANTTTVTVEAPGPGVVVVTEGWAQGDLTAVVNGRAAAVLRANQAFRAVAIPAAGTWTVEFRYRPRVLSWALGVAAAGAALLLGGLLAAA